MRIATTLAIAAVVTSLLSPMPVALAGLVAVQPGGLVITAPASANLGSFTIGSTRSAQLATVRVASQQTPTWTARVSATSFTTTGGTITTGNVSYWSGPATESTGPGVFIPGEPTASQAVVLTAPRTAFSRNGSSGVHSVSWNPTLVIRVPVTAAFGTYQGTVTHTVT